MRLKPAAPRSRVKHSTTEPPDSVLERFILKMLILKKSADDKKAQKITQNAKN